MKIAIDARMYGTENGGIGRYIVNLIKEFQRIDDKNNYVLLLRKKYFSLLNTKDNWEKVLIDVRHYSFKEQFAVTQVLNRLKPDLVHFPHFNIPVFYQGKSVVTIHDLLMHKRTGAAATTLPLPAYLVKRLGYKFVFEKAVKKAVKVIVPTNFVKKEVAKKYPSIADKLLVVYEGVDESVFDNPASGGYLRRNRIDKPYFIYVGSVYPHKNVSRIIEAISHIGGNLVVVTPRNVFQKRLDEYVRSHNAQGLVKFTGYVNDHDLSALYKNAVAFVYPSLEEGFGLPGLEAMANKCLVLASDIPVFREVYKKNALYFNPMDFSSIEKSMKEALEVKPVKKAEITSKAYEFVKTYSWEETAKQTLKIYENAS